MSRTRWRPDTCSCQIEYEKDPINPDQVVGKVIHNACPDHAALTNPETHCAVVLGENKLKNRVYGIAIEMLSRLTQTRTQNDGSLVTELKETSPFTWSFRLDRVLQVSIGNINENERRSMQSEADKRLGAGRVVIG
jgi:hypothetical protein